MFEGVPRDNLFIKRFGGLSNTNYGIIYQNKKYVLRIPGTFSDIEISRSIEHEIIKSVTRLGLTSNTEYFDTQTGIYLRQYIEGEEILPEKIDNKILSKVAVLLRKYHHSNIKLPLILNNFDRIRNYIVHLSKFSVLSEKKYKKYLDEIYRFEFLINKLNPIVAPTHNDASPINFLSSAGRLFLLDWEYASMADPIWDIAYFATFGCLNKHEISLLLKYYYDEKVPPMAVNVVNTYLPVAELIMALRLKMMLVKSNFHLPKDEIEEWEEVSLLNLENALNCKYVQESVSELDKIKPQLDKSL